MSVHPRGQLFPREIDAGTPAFEELRAFFSRLTECVSGYFGRVLVKVDGTTGEARIRIAVDGDNQGSEFGPFEAEGFPARAIEVDCSSSDLYGVIDVLWAFMAATNYWLWWPLRLHLRPLAGTHVITLYAGTPIGVQGSRAMPIVAILRPDDLVPEPT